MVEEQKTKIVPMLQCRTLDGWYPVVVPSDSDPDIEGYTVHVNPWGRSERHICECKGFTYRGTCKHQKIAHNTICGWNEVEGPEEATELHRTERKCPRCNGPASYAMWETTEDE